MFDSAVRWHASTAVGDDDARVLEAEVARVRRAADRDQHAVEEHRLGRVLAREGRRDAVGTRAQALDLRVEENLIERVAETFLERLDEISITAGQETVGKLDDRDARTEARVDRPHLETDVATADDEETVRHVLELEGSRRVHDARIVDAQDTRDGRRRAGRDDRVLENDLGRLLAHAGRRAVGPLERQGIRVREACTRRQVLDAARRAELADAARELLDDAVLPIAQLRQVDRRLLELETPSARLARLVRQLRDMEQRLRRDAATVETDAARLGLGVDQRRSKTELRSMKRCRIATRARSDHDHLGFDRATRHSSTRPLLLFILGIPIRRSDSESKHQ